MFPPSVFEVLVSVVPFYPHGSGAALTLVNDDFEMWADLYAPPPAPLSLSLSSPDTTGAGEPVPLRLTLKNEGSRPGGIEFEDYPVPYDLIVTRADGNVVWHRMYGKVVAGSPNERVFAPEDSAVFDTVWDQRNSRGEQLPAGSYRVWGAIVANPFAWDPIAGSRPPDQLLPYAAGIPVSHIISQPRPLFLVR